MMQHLELIRNLEAEIQKLPASSDFHQLSFLQTRSQQLLELIDKRLSGIEAETCSRVREEFVGFGPLHDLLKDASITEIMVNGPRDIWIEREGRLSRHPDQFATDLSFKNFCHRLQEEAHINVTSEVPTAHGHIRNFRLHLVGGELTKAQAHFCLRRHPDNPWTFERLAHSGWGSEEQQQQLQYLVDSHLNFLVIGGTGTGKTSVLNACLQSLPKNERCILIEDTLELRVPNSASMRLLTREDPNGILKRIDQSELVKNSLRLRPDRIVMGEIRGDEAKDFLMALSTGHAGSFGTLHASNAAQALIRLEMLIQLGAPHWSLSAVRRLIQLSLQAIVVIGRRADGKRCLEGIYRLSSLEENGILLEKTC